MKIDLDYVLDTYGMAGNNNVNNILLYKRLNGEYELHLLIPINDEQLDVIKVKTINDYSMAYQVSELLCMIFDCEQIYEEKSHKLNE